MISSKSGKPRRTMSSCPFVIGSKEPGNTAISLFIGLNFIHFLFQFLRAYNVRISVNEKI